MALLEVTTGHCTACGHRLVIQVWWPMVEVVKRLAALGGLQGLDADDLAALLGAAQQADEFERDDGDGLDPGPWLAGAGSVLVDGGKGEQAILCPECGGLLGILARQRVG